MEVVGHCGPARVQTSEYRFITSDDVDVQSTPLEEPKSAEERKILFSVDELLPFTMAMTVCKNQVEGSTLATMRNDFDYNSTIQLLGSFAKNQDIFSFIGATRLKPNGDFYWLSDHSLASFANGRPSPYGIDNTYWDHDQPDNAGNSEFFIALKNMDNTKLTWHDVGEFYYASSLCEFLF